MIHAAGCQETRPHRVLVKIHYKRLYGKEGRHQPRQLTESFRIFYLYVLVGYTLRCILQMKFWLPRLNFHVILRSGQFGCTHARLRRKAKPLK